VNKLQVQLPPIVVREPTEDDAGIGGSVWVAEEWTLEALRDPEVQYRQRVTAIVEWGDEKTLWFDWVDWDVLNPQDEIVTRIAGRLLELAMLRG